MTNPPTYLKCKGGDFKSHLRVFPTTNANSFVSGLLEPWSAQVFLVRTDLWGGAGRIYIRAPN